MPPSEEIRLAEIDEGNWAQALNLAVREEQRPFLADAAGILARGYAYRRSRARVRAVCAGETLVGLMLVRDLDEAPACYDLNQFMIDRRYQNRGYGSRALALLLEELAAERKYPAVELCVRRDAAQALRVYGRAGFRDTGWTDPENPDCLNLRYTFD